MIAAVGTLLVFAILFVVDYIFTVDTSNAAQGAFDILTSHPSINPFPTLFIGTVFGILSSIVLSGYAGEGKQFKELLNRKTIIISCVIAPVVIGGFYEKISAIQSQVVILVLSYQNGYFWESLSILAGRVKNEN